jgi:hypothetical protein
MKENSAARAAVNGRTASSRGTTRMVIRRYIDLDDVQSAAAEAFQVLAFVIETALAQDVDRRIVEIRRSLGEV